MSTVQLSTSGLFYKASAGVYSDRSGPEMITIFKDMANDASWRLDFVEYVSDIVADEIGTVTRLC